MKRYTTALVIIILLAVSTPAAADRGIAVEFFLGGAWNASTNLKVEQNGRPTIELDGIFNTGHELAGPALLAGVGRSFSIYSGFFFTPEIQLSAAWVRVGVADGKATTTDVALHLMLGVGYAF
jgi:hypothetical protein